MEIKAAQEKVSKMKPEEMEKEECLGFKWDKMNLELCKEQTEKMLTKLMAAIDANEVLQYLNSTGN